ncbi:MAG: ABC transporter substrate-binding protein [Tissierellia bacterium]|nr:ABC transporter substrate-binding protein [Bacillota bacterium]NLL23495.1 ABC transporter substrate-binding protein [Tissierellia bacterium]
MKKKLVVGLVLMLLLSACSVEKPADEVVFKIGITQIAEHPALDAAREGFLEELESSGLKVDVEYRNAQGDSTTNGTIGASIGEGKDLVFAISTTSAQAAKAGGGDVPILFTAVTDPVEAQLVESMEVPGGTISGTSDKTPVALQLKLLKRLVPDVKSVGILFNTSEVNSEVQIRWAKEAAEELGLNIVEVGVTTVNEIPQALENLISRTDAIYTITDNLVANSIQLVVEKTREMGVVTMGAERAHVESGILITDGIDYRELGRQTARMAIRILKEKANPAEMAVETLDNTELVINQMTKDLLGIEIPEDVLNRATIVE